MGWADFFGWPMKAQARQPLTTSHIWLYLPNAEITLDLEVNEVEVRVLTSLASVVAITEV
jgi:hypothetical protein